MNRPFLFKSILGLLLVTAACSDDEPAPTINPGIPPPTNTAVCKVQEMEFRNEDDEIISIREFTYNVNRNNRLESISIVEGLNGTPLNLRFRLNYREDHSIVPFNLQEVFGAEIITSIDFRFDAQGKLIEFTQNQSDASTSPPESHVFFYEESDLANDSINTRIIIFDIDRLTRDWIDVFPALFTVGGERITRFEKVSFRGDLQEFCDFTYNQEGHLEQIICRAFDGLLIEVWDFFYQNNRLESAFRQLPNFRALTEYQYDSQGRPSRVVSTSNGFFNWQGAYFYLCR